MKDIADTSFQIDEIAGLQDSQYRLLIVMAEEVMSLRAMMLLQIDLLNTILHQQGLNADAVDRQAAESLQEYKKLILDSFLVRLRKIHDQNPEETLQEQKDYDK